MIRQDEVSDVVENCLFGASRAADFILRLKGTLGVDGHKGLAALIAGVVLASEVDWILRCPFAVGAFSLDHSNGYITSYVEVINGTKRDIQWSNIPQNPRSIGPP